MPDNDKAEQHIWPVDVIFWTKLFVVGRAFGYYKAKRQLPSKDPDREAKQYDRIIELAEQYGLDPEFAKSYLKAVIERVINNHEKILTQTQLEAGN